MIPDQLLWPGVAVIVLIAIFVTAAVVGPLIRANTMEDDEDTEEKTSE
jgi:p-aminobenzoyl-glutamate transporter AbgT